LPPELIGNMPNKVRVIEYEFMLWEELESWETLAQQIVTKMGRPAEVGILRCTTRSDTKITLVGGADATRSVIESGEANKPSGVVIARSDFPVMIQGWPSRLGGA
jgi:hypothetical protein